LAAGLAHIGGGYALAMTLKEYRQKRRSGRGAEPRGRRRRGSRKLPHFVIQHHAASTDHYDFRLEIDGVLVSWAVPKGPSTNPKDKRMARRTEDHPMEYETFEGVIPEGEYGAGRVIVWDRGTYQSDRDVAEDLNRGHLSFRLDGDKLRGGYALTRFRTGKDEAWLLVKKSDEDADARRKPVRSQPESVLSGRTLDELS
jgi:DNA ligase D-like protein (predicted 3'-phosphoesterase)